ncbi:MAG: GEVED domain-containing protein [Flavobacteriaceae bacterium]|jgi:hypothetical protein|nr:GEVED domain-containing protein [Flavobacteriaceae bacterium]
MKKFLLSCFLALSLGANAQIFFNYDSGTGANPPPSLVATGGFTGGTGIYNITGWCETLSYMGNVYAGANAYTLTYTSPAGITSNGGAIDYAFNWGVLGYSDPTEARGSVQIAYAAGTTGGTFTNIGTPITFTTEQDCVDTSGTIPTGTIPSGQGFRFRITVTAAATGTPTADMLWGLNTIDLAQDVTAAPNCVSITSPTNGATNVGVRSAISWPITPGAQSYNVRIGTTSGGADVVNATTFANSYAPPSTNALPANTHLYARIDATNSQGTTIGCSVIEFDTGPNPFAPYCGPILSTGAPMFSLNVVTMNGTTYTNTVSTGSNSSTLQPHLNFISNTFNVDPGQTYPIDMTAMGIAGNFWGFSVFIDWNQDGDFDDAGENYFNTSSTLLNTSTATGGLVTRTGNIAVPAGALPGPTRMRVRYGFVGSATTIHNNIANACNDIGNGQVHDYTINVTAPPATYCTPGGTAVAARRIDGFSTTGGTTNISNLNSGFSPGGYGDFYNTHSVAQEVGQAVNFTINLGDTLGYGARIWVDWNQDGIFDTSATSNEIAFFTSSYVFANTITGTITVPTTALEGETRMRVVNHYNSGTGLIDPCSTTHTSGEFEDYKFIVNPLPTAVPGCATITAPSGTVNAGSTTITWNPVTDAFGYKLKIGTTAGGDDVLTETTLTGTSYTLGLAISTTYHVSLVPFNNKGDATGCADYTFSTNTTLNYCIPQGTNNTRFVNNFSTTGGTGNNISNLGTGFSSGGYGDYYNTQTVSQAVGGTVNFSVDISGGTAGFRVWVDWNQDGTFDPVNEIAYQSLNYFSNHTGAITVPATALPGPTRMRIVSHWSSSSGDTSPCQTGFVSGEFEDYKFIVDPLPTVAPGCATITAPSGTVNAGLTTITWNPVTDAFGYKLKVGTTAGGDEILTETTVSGTSYPVSGLTINTTYHVSLVPFNNKGDATGCADYTFSTNNTLTYCIPTGPTNNSDEILNFTLGSINNTSAPSEGTNGYMDYTGTVPPADLEVGSSQVASLTTNSGSGNHGAAIWIDYNDDGVFSTSEMVTNIPNSAIANTTTNFPPFTVEDSPGTHRLRVQYTYFQDGSGLDPCNVTTIYSETEDYLVNIMAVATGCLTDPYGEYPHSVFTPQCIGAPETIVADAWAGEYSTVAVTAGTEYIFSSSVATDFITIGDDTGTTVLASGTGSVTWTATASANVRFYTHLDSACTPDNTTTRARMIQCGTLVLNYCIPEGTNSSRYINNFTTTGGTGNDISNLNSGFSPGGYGDFYATHKVSNVVGGTVNFNAIHGDVGQTFGFRIWVDWNQDGTFDPVNEVVYQSSGYGPSQSGTITVPTTALPGDTRMRIANHWLDTEGPDDPCTTAFTYGEFEDYKFTVDPLPTVKPDCTTITNPSGPAPIIINAGLNTITWTAVANAFGYHVKVGTSSGGGEVFFDDVTGTSISVSLQPNTTYYVSVVPYNNMGDANPCNNEVEFETDDTLVYCIPEGTNSTRYIDNFSTTGGNPDNISNLGSGFSPGGYGDFYNTHTVSQIEGGTVNFTADFAGGTFGFRIWVDWNQDGTFDPVNEVAFQSNAWQPSWSGSFAIPSSALSGETRMRIACHWLDTTGPADPCLTGADSQYVEFEDYKFNVIQPTAAPDCTTITNPANGAVLNPGSTTITWNAAANASGYHVKVGTTSGGTDVFGGDVSGTSQTVTLSQNGTYYASVVPFNSLGGANPCSNEITFTTNDNAVYCEPNLNCTDGDLILNVSFEEIDNSTTCSPNGYGDYTNMVANVEAGETYTLYVTVGDGWYEHVGMWIDFGNDGIFDPSDYFGEIGIGGQGVTTQGDITIPAGTPDGNYRMRIQAYAGPLTGDPCMNNPLDFGEYEDYTVHVGALATAETNKGKIVVYPNPVTDILKISDVKDVKSIIVVDMTGRMVKTFSTATAELNLSNLSSGAYIVNLRMTNGETQSVKVIKK